MLSLKNNILTLNLKEYPILNQINNRWRKVKNYQEKSKKSYIKRKKILY